MDVTPQQLREVTFKEKMRGYNQDDVDEVLERAADAMEALAARVREAEERAAQAEQRASEGSDVDGAMKRTLVLAQRTADAAIKEAEEEAAQTLASAREQAEAMVAEAEQRARREETEAQGRLRADIAALEQARAHLQADVDALGAYVEAARGSIRETLTEQLRLVDEGGLSVPPPPAVAEVTVPPEPVYEVVEGGDAAPAGEAEELDELPAAADDGDDDDFDELEDLDEGDRRRFADDDDEGDGEPTGAYTVLGEDPESEAFFTGIEHDFDGVRQGDADPEEPESDASPAPPSGGDRPRRGMRRRR
jgi:cell division initiation protein